MWKNFKVTLEMTGRFAASLPKTKEEIEKMLANRMPAHKPENFIPVSELTEEVAAKVDPSGEEELQFGWATFPRDETGLYYEGRCIRGHIKDCANQIKDAVKPVITALKAKVSNKVYVLDDVIYLGSDKVAGTEQRFIQVMTRQGPRSTIKYIDYLEKPTLSFTIKLLEDGVINEDILRSIFEYGAVHGLGQERSQGWGRYKYTLEEVK